ncbi:MAG: branched-chain amino acid ABC transporter permease [Anaerolineales bacterium]
MAEQDRASDAAIPESPAGEARIGADEWVVQEALRRQQRAGVFAGVANMWDSIPAAARYAIAALFLIIAPPLSGLPFVVDLLGISSNEFIVRTGAQFLTFAMLAMGLNVVVGYAGLLDLGYVAFFGVAGYSYAYLSSEFIQIGGFIPHGIAVPSIVSVPLIIAFTALVGWILGSVSIRLVGDYLAIVTLGFGQLFVQLATTATRVKLPWVDHTVDFTRGPNGINHLDPIAVFGFRFETTLQYYYLFLVLGALVYLFVFRINHSRLGRAWRAMRENELAAEVMGMPTRRLKLMAFAIGAGIAALAGSVNAAWQSNVVPAPRYSVLTLINLYAMVVLGGIGSLPGVVIGAFAFTVLPELLRSIALAGFLFYLGGLIALLALLRPFKRFMLVLGGTIAAGALLKLIVHVLWPGLDSGFPPSGSIINNIVQGWLVIPQNFELVGNIIAGAAAFVLLATILLKPPYRWISLGVAIYTLAFAWETRLAVEPAATRILILGITLITLMVTRPQGLLGKPQVTVV